MLPSSRGRQESMPAAPPVQRRSPLRLAARIVGWFACLPLGVVCLGLVACQDRLIYPSRHYAQVMWERLPPGVEPLRYDTDQGKQVSFYQQPRSGGEPRQLWLVCSGNGGVALAWPDLLANAPDREAGFLLLDYPGYGFSEGSCTPQRILRASEAAVAALGEHLRLPREELDRRLGVFGHSLGAAAALQYAARHPVRRVVLAAPFTTMVDEANHATFWPLGYCVWHRFDNLARLAELAASPQPPAVVILHGDLDQVIPHELGERLAASQPGIASFRLVHGADHDGVALDAIPELTP